MTLKQAFGSALLQVCVNENINVTAQMISNMADSCVDIVYPTSGVSGSTEPLTGDKTPQNETRSFEEFAKAFKEATGANLNVINVSDALAQEDGTQIQFHKVDSINDMLKLVEDLAGLNDANDAQSPPQYPNFRCVTTPVEGSSYKSRSLKLNSIDTTEDLMVLRDIGVQEISIDNYIHVKFR